MLTVAVKRSLKAEQRRSYPDHTPLPVFQIMEWRNADTHRHNVGEVYPWGRDYQVLRVAGCVEVRVKVINPVPEFAQLKRGI